MSKRKRGKMAYPKAHLLQRALFYVTEAEGNRKSGRTLPEATFKYEYRTSYTN